MFVQKTGILQVVKTLGSGYAQDVKVCNDTAAIWAVRVITWLSRTTSLVDAPLSFFFHFQHSRNKSPTFPSGGQVNSRKVRKAGFGLLARSM